MLLLVGVKREVSAARYPVGRVVVSREGDSKVYGWMSWWYDVSGEHDGSSQDSQIILL